MTTIDLTGVDAAVAVRVGVLNPRATKVLVPGPGSGSPQAPQEPLDQYDLPFPAFGPDWSCHFGLQTGEYWWNGDENGWLMPAVGIPPMAPAHLVAGPISVLITGTIQGSVLVDPTAPLLWLPSWARPGGDWDLTNCGKIQVRWVSQSSDDPYPWTVYRTDTVGGTIHWDDGSITLEPGWADNIPAGADTILVDFGAEQWYHRGDRPVGQSVWEVHTIAQGAIDTTAVWPGEWEAGWHVLVQWVTEGGGDRGLYRIDDTGHLIDRVDLFDGNHNGTVIWAYQQLDDANATVAGPTLWGIYTTESCSLVQLTPTPASLPATFREVDTDGDRLRPDDGHIVFTYDDPTTFAVVAEDMGSVTNRVYSLRSTSNPVTLDTLESGIQWYTPDAGANGQTYLMRPYTQVLIGWIDGLWTIISDSSGGIADGTLGILDPETVAAAIDAEATKYSGYGVPLDSTRVLYAKLGIAALYPYSPTTVRKALANVSALTQELAGQSLFVQTAQIAMGLQADTLGRIVEETSASLGLEYSGPYIVGGEGSMWTGPATPSFTGDGLDLRAMIRPMTSSRGVGQSPYTEFLTCVLVDSGPGEADRYEAAIRWLDGRPWDFFEWVAAGGSIEIQQVNSPGHIPGVWREVRYLLIYDDGNGQGQVAIQHRTLDGNNADETTEDGKHWRDVYRARTIADGPASFLDRDDLVWKTGEHSMGASHLAYLELRDGIDGPIALGYNAADATDPTTIPDLALEANWVCTGGQVQHTDDDPEPVYTDTTLFATAAQGAKADTAVQPDDLDAVATTASDAASAASSAQSTADSAASAASSAASAASAAAATASGAATSISDHLADGTDAHDASAVSVVPTGTIAATDVQGALAELDTEKVATTDSRLKRVVEILVTDPGGTAVTTGDSKAYFRVPSLINGWALTSVGMSVSTVSSSGIPTVQVRKVRSGSGDIDMLTTKVTVDANEIDSSTAATAAVIDTASSRNIVSTGDQLHIDVDVAGTGTKGLAISLTLEQ